MALKDRPIEGRTLLPVIIAAQIDSSGNVVSIDSTSPLSVNERPVRSAAIAHRTAVIAVDKVADMTNAMITTADNGAGTGLLNASTTYDMTIVPGNRYGSCKVATTINTQATAASGLNTHSIRLTWAQVANAEWYDVFLSDAAAPLWVARVTEAQRAAGDFEVTAVGVVAAGGGNPAGSIDVNVAGTGQATNQANFAQNNAYLPANATSIDCSGRIKVHILVELTLTDLRSAPSLNIIPFLQNASSGNWCAGNLLSVNVLQGLGQPLKQDFWVSVDGASGLIVLVDTITGQGASASIWVERV